MSANADADLDVEAYVPLTIEVTDAVILSAQRSMTIGDSFYTLDQGGVYFNGIELEAAGTASSSIDIALDYDNGASVDWSGYLGVSGVGAVTNLNITGQAYNQDGTLSASNAVGGINVKGPFRRHSQHRFLGGLSINSMTSTTPIEIRVSTRAMALKSKASYNSTWWGNSTYTELETP